MDQGRLHLYWGEGKGKTTAATGLALRALGSGFRVTVVQFLKDGTSGELEPLRTLGAAIYAAMEFPKFVFQMSETEKEQTRVQQTALLRQALCKPCDLMILDEACAAYQLGMVDRDLLKQVVLRRPAGCEAVLTGREPAPWMVQAADYITEMRCCRHPYETGLAARKGIEY